MQQQSAEALPHVLHSFMHVHAHSVTPNKLCHNASRVQWAAFAAGLGLDEPMKRDVVREDEVFFNVAAENFQVKYTAS